MTKTQIEILIDRCTGCRACETACSFRHTRQYSPAFSRIQVRSNQGICLSVPCVCMQCAPAPCAAACDQGALSRDNSLGAVVVKEESCTGCGLCVEACVYSAMHFDDSSDIAYKCELCGGDPECVKVCAPGALRLVTGFQIDPAHQSRVAAVVERLTNAQSS